MKTYPSIARPLLPLLAVLLATSIALAAPGVYSVREFHSFRVTWITLALAAGVPLELVQRVTGHRTVEVVMKHYFRPGREVFRQTIMKAMPKMLADGGAPRSVKDEMREIIENITPRTWNHDKVRLLNLLEAMRCL